MSQGRIFGTDGIRGRAGEGWLSVERVTLLGRALAQVLGDGGGGRALVAHDGRRSGPTLEGVAGIRDQLPPRLAADFFSA